MTRQVTEFVYTTPGAQEVENTLNRIANAGGNVGKKMKEGAAEAGAGFKLLSATMGEASNGVQSLAGGLGPMGRVISSLGPGGLAAAAGIGALVTVFAQGAQEAEKHNRANRQTEAILRATGNQAGKTAKEIRDLANEMERKTLADDVAVKNAANMLLTFENISGKTFDNIIRRAQDLAANGFGTLESNVKALGKAFQDPVNGLSALNRMGVTFDPVQKKLIENLVESNRLLDAQALVMDELTKKVGGAGESEQAGLTGSINALSDAWGNFIEAVTSEDGIDVTGNTIGLLADALNALSEAIDPTTLQQLSSAMGELFDVQRGLRDAGMSQNAIDNSPRVKAIRAEIAALQEKLNAEKEVERNEKLIAEQAANRARVERENAVKEEKRAKDAEEDFKKIGREHERFLDEMDRKKKQRDNEAKADAERREKEAQKEIERKRDLIETAEVEADAAHRLREAQEQGEVVMERVRNDLEVEAALRKLGADATDEQRESLEKLIRARQADDAAMASNTANQRAEEAARREAAQKLDRQLEQHERDVEAWMRDMNATFRDFWIEAFDGSLKDALPAVGETLMRWWIGLQSQMLMRPLILPFAQAMAGAGGGGGRGVSAGDMGGMAGMSMGTGGFWGLGGASDIMTAGAQGFARSGIGQWLGLSTMQDMTGGLYPTFAGQAPVMTGLGNSFANAVGDSPWGMIGTLGANALGWNGTGNALADTGLSMVGSIGGSMAGAAALGSILGSAAGPVGAIIGAFLAQGFGSLIAGRPSDRMESTTIDLRSGARTYVGLGPDKDSPENQAAANTIIDAVEGIARVITQTTGGQIGMNRLTAEAGTRSGFRVFGANDATGVGFDQSFSNGQQAFRAALDFMLSEITGVSAAVRTAIDNIDWEGDLTIAARNLDAITQFEAAVASLTDEIDRTSPVQQALAAIKAQFSGMQETLIPLGITLEQITDAETTAINALKATTTQGINDRILQLTNPEAYDYAILDRTFETIRDDAEALGIDTALIDRLYNEERKAINRRYHQDVIADDTAAARERERIAKENNDFAVSFIQSTFDKQIQAREEEINAAQRAANAWRQASSALSGLALRFAIGEESGMTLEQRQADVMGRLENAFAKSKGPNADPEAASLIAQLAPEAANLTKAFFRDNAEGVSAMNRIRQIVNESANTAANQLTAEEQQVNLLTQIRDALIGSRNGVGQPAPTAGITGAQAQAVMQNYAIEHDEFIRGGGTEAQWASRPEFQAWIATRDAVINSVTDTNWLNNSLSYAQSHLNDPVYGQTFQSQVNMINNRLSSMGMVRDNGGTIPMTGYALVHRGEEIVNQSGMAKFGSELNGVAMALRGQGAMMAEGFNRLISVMERVVANTGDAQSAAMIAGIMGMK